MPKKVTVVFHNGWTYHYHFIIKQLPEEFEGQFECLNKEKYIAFSVPVKKEVPNGKEEEEDDSKKKKMIIVKKRMIIVKKGKQSHAK